jgi:AraC-like DNA-binding protein
MSSTPETQLAYLGFQRILPGPLLRPYVRSYWYFQRETPLLTYHEEFMHPRGGFGVAFNLGESLWLDSQPLAAPIFLDGANTVSRRMGFLGRVELMGISFREGEAYPFLAVPLAELRNETALLDALDRPSLMQLYGRLYDAESLTARIDLLDQWLLGRLALGKARDSLIPASLALLREGQLPIPELARQFAISQRQLERLYQSQVGMSPKQYVQLQRIETARVALKQVQSNTTLAVDLGFYDQSHFIRGFTAVIGMTPYRYMQRSQQAQKTPVAGGR